MKLDPQNEEHRVLIESIEETFAAFFGQMAMVEAFSEMVDSFYAQMDEQVDELENIMHEVLEPLDALEKSMDEAIENFMRYFDAPESPIRQVEELLCGENEMDTRFGKVILEELDRDSARYHLDNNRYLDMDVTVSGFHIANSRDCDLLSDRIIEVMEQVHILWDRGELDGDHNININIDDLTKPVELEDVRRQVPIKGTYCKLSEIESGTYIPESEIRQPLPKKDKDGLYDVNGHFSGVHLQTHEVFDKTDPLNLIESCHSLFRITPIDQERWLKDSEYGEYFKANKDENGLHFMTIAAGNEGGKFLYNQKLVSNINRKNDISKRKKTSYRLPYDIEKENRLIERILQLDEKYRDKLDYDLLPKQKGKTIVTDGYNCNSYTTGILKALGITVPKPSVKLPGWDKPMDI